jgi:hypothetical protein
MPPLFRSGRPGCPPPPRSLPSHRYTATASHRPAARRTRRVHGRTCAGVPSLRAGSKTAEVWQEYTGGEGGASRGRGWGRGWVEERQEVTRLRPHARPNPHVPHLKRPNAPTYSDAQSTGGGIPNLRDGLRPHDLMPAQTPRCAPHPQRPNAPTYSDAQSTGAALDLTLASPNRDLPTLPLIPKLRNCNCAAPVDMHCPLLASAARRRHLAPTCSNLHPACILYPPFFTPRTGCCHNSSPSREIAHDKLS